jgi:hypothetical protein
MILHLCKTLLNFSVVMGVGDSITAGLGARWTYSHPSPFVFEDYGVSFATGGDKDTVSIATLLENSNTGKTVKGKSFGSRRVQLCIDKPANSESCEKRLFYF